MTASISDTTAACDLLDLMERIAHRDESALAEICRRTRTRLSAMIRRIVRDESLTEEVLQDVFLYVWRNAGQYRLDRGAPLAWIYTLARSRAIDALRRNRDLAITAPLDRCVQHLSAQPVSEGPSETWWHAVIRQGIHELPEMQQVLIAMAFVEGYTHVEIADSLGLPLGTVKGRIRLALAKLREYAQVRSLPTPAGPSPRHRSAEVIEVAA